MSNIRTLPGLRSPEDTAKPNDELIAALRRALEMAESGQLQCYIGTGFTSDGLRLATWCDLHDDVYQMLGSLEWLKAEYIERHSTSLR
jgi:hypothetical protein